MDHGSPKESHATNASELRIEKTDVAATTTAWDVVIRCFNQRIIDAAKAGFTAGLIVGSNTEKLGATAREADIFRRGRLDGYGDGFLFGCEEACRVLEAIDRGRRLLRLSLLVAMLLVGFVLGWGLR